MEMTSRQWPAVTFLLLGPSHGLQRSPAISPVHPDIIHDVCRCLAAKVPRDCSVTGEQSPSNTPPEVSPSSRTPLFFPWSLPDHRRRVPAAAARAPLACKHLLLQLYPIRVSGNQARCGEEKQFLRN